MQHRLGHTLIRITLTRLVVVRAVAEHIHAQITTHVFLPPPNLARALAVVIRTALAIAATTGNADAIRRSPTNAAYASWLDMRPGSRPNAQSKEGAARVVEAVVDVAVDVAVDVPLDVVAKRMAVAGKASDYTRAFHM